jgi:hypothetical protein
MTSASNTTAVDHTINVVVEHQTRAVTVETYIVNTYVNGDLRTREIMPMGKFGKEDADYEVAKVAKFCDKHGYTFKTSTVETN